MPAKQDSAATGDAPIMLRKELVLSGTSMPEPIIMSDIQYCSSKQPYVQLTVKSKWLCLLATGSLPRNRPLASCKLFELLKARISDAWTSPADDGAEGPVDGLALLGLADEVVHQEQTKRYHRKRQDVGLQNWRAVSVPVGPKSAQSRTIKVLLKSAREAPWIELTTDNLSWLRQYLRDEIAALGANPEGSTTSSAADAEQQGLKLLADEELIWWCNATSSWRISATPPGSKTRVRSDVYVSRSPPETFRERVQLALEKAKERKRMMENGESWRLDKSRKRAGQELEGGELSELQDDPAAAIAAPIQDEVSDQKASPVIPATQRRRLHLGAGELFERPKARRGTTLTMQGVMDRWAADADVSDVL